MTFVEEGDSIKVVTCGIQETHLPHFWHGGARFCPAGEVIVGEWDVKEVLMEALRDRNPHGGVITEGHLAEYPSEKE